MTRQPHSHSVTRIDPAVGAAQLSEALGDFEFDPRQSYADQVHVLLRDAIVRGLLPPGTPLSEAAISSVVGVSRTPVREALRMLMQESLVNVFPQAGTLVSPVRLGLLHEGRFVRRALECENLVELVKVVTPEQIAELEDLLARQRQVLDAGRPNEFFALDEALHRRLLEFMGRERIWTLLQAVKLHHDRVRWLFVAHDSERAYLEHCAIVACLAARDLAGLLQAMQAHVNSVESRLDGLRCSAPDGYLTD